MELVLTGHQERTSKESKRGNITQNIEKQRISCFLQKSSSWRTGISKYCGVKQNWLNPQQLLPRLVVMCNYLFPLLSFRTLTWRGWKSTLTRIVALRIGVKMVRVIGNNWHPRVVPGIVVIISLEAKIGARSKNVVFLHSFLLMREL